MGSATRGRASLGATEGSGTADPPGEREATVRKRSCQRRAIVNPFRQRLLHSRRSFLTSTASGIGLLALASLLRDDGLLAATPAAEAAPLAPKAPHFTPKAKACICIYLEGAPSQIDLFDPKPKLNDLNGQPLPESMTKTVRFAFIQKETARLMGCPRVFTKHGQCGMDLSDYLPHLATCADDL